MGRRVPHVGMRKGPGLSGFPWFFLVGLKEQALGRVPCDL